MGWTIGETDEGSETRGGPLLKGIGILLATVVVAWMLAYLGGIFPWLGSRDYERRPGILLAAEQSSAGTHAMLLFAGQTAFIDYEFEAKARGQIVVDIRPWPGIERSDRHLLLEADGAGRLERRIERTGVYYFHVDQAIAAYQEPMRFSASWGAY